MSALAQNYRVKVIDLSGNVIADPLPVTNVSFTRRLSMPGNRQIGDFDIDLIPPRGPNAHHIVTYQQLDSQQRVEIYEDETLGTPVFTGYIIDSTSALLSWSIGGDEWIGRLGQRRSARFEILDDSVTTLIAQYLDIWDFRHFIDDFNRASVGGDWTQDQGVWGITTVNSRQYLTTVSGGPPWEISHTLALSTDQDDYFRVFIEWTSGALIDDWSRAFTVFGNGTNPWILTITHVANEEKTALLLVQIGTNNFPRDAGKYELPFGERTSTEFWIRDSALGQQCQIYLNGREFMISDSNLPGIGGDLILVTDEVDSLFDAVIIFTREPIISPGTIAATGATIEYESPQDTEFQIISMLADYVNYEWRTQAQAGAGNDLIDMDQAVGSDLSTTVRLVEGVNLQGLQLSTSGKGLQTWISFVGQGADKNAALATAWDKTAFETFDIIEAQLSNPRVSEPNLAQSLADHELVQTKDNTASMSASVFINPNLPAFDVGDTVWVEALVPDIAQTAKVISISYETASPYRQVTFNQFPRSRSGMVGKLTESQDLVFRMDGPQANEVVFTFDSGSRYIDDSDGRFVFNDGSPIVRNAWLKYVNGMALPFPDFRPANGTLTFGGNPGCFADISLACTALKLVHQSDTNLTLCQVSIDGSLANVINQNGAFQNRVAQSVSFAGVTPGLHVFRFAKEATVDGNPDLLLTIDSLILGSFYWSIFVEGRAVNSAFLTFNFSNQSSTPPTQIFIDGVDQTVALGGPGPGFTANQNRLDVSPYISAPGLHGIDFHFGSGNDTDTSINATLSVQLFA